MPTRNIVPRANGEGQLGTNNKKWGGIYVNTINASTINGNLQGSINGITLKGTAGQTYDLQALEERMQVLMPKAVSILDRENLPADKAFIHKQSDGNYTVDDIDTTGNLPITRTSYIPLKREYYNFHSLLFMFCDDGGNGRYPYVVPTWQLTLMLPQGIVFQYGYSKQYNAINHWTITSQEVAQKDIYRKFNVRLGTEYETENYKENSGLIDVLGVNPVEEMV